MALGEHVKIKVEHLTKKFGDLLVLDDLSFHVKKGEFLCVVGPTGCGKTTFLNLLSCLIEPTAGRILIDGVPADPKKTRHCIRVSGGILISVADGEKQYRIRHENERVAA